MAGRHCDPWFSFQTIYYSSHSAESGGACEPRHSFTPCLASASGALVSYLVVKRGDAWRASAAQSKWMRRGGGDAAMLLILIALGVALSSIESLGFFPLLQGHGTWPLLEGGLWATSC
jgi:hypothetical protein